MSHVISNAKALLLLGFAGLSSPIVAQEYDPFARDLKILTSWFEGRFDNSEQMWFIGDSRSPEEMQDYNIRMHVMHRRLDLPNLGEHIFYVEEYRDHDPSKVIRQRIVRFTSDAEENAIRMEQGFFKNKEQYVGGYADPSKFDGLTADDVFFMRDLDPDGKCDVFWRRDGGQYRGAMLEKQCLHVTKPGEGKRYYVHDMTLGKDYYWRVDTSFWLADDKRHVGVPRDEPVAMNRAREFECKGNFRPIGGSFYTSEGVVPMEPFMIHDQGGTATITREADGKSFDVLLRKKEYSFYDTQPDFLYLSVRPSGVPRSLTYTISDVSSVRFGVFNDQEGIQLFCNRPGYEFRETSEELERLESNG